MALHKTRGSDRLTRPNPVIPFPTKNLALRGSLFSLFQPVSIMDQELKAMPLSYWTKLHIRSLHPVSIRTRKKTTPPSVHFKHSTSPHAREDILSIYCNKIDPKASSPFWFI